MYRSLYEHISCNFLSTHLEMELLGSYDYSVWFFENYKNNLNHFTFKPTRKEGSNLFIIFMNLLLFLLITAILEGIKWYFCMVSICIYLLTDISIFSCAQQSCAYIFSWSLFPDLWAFFFKKGCFLIMEFWEVFWYTLNPLLRTFSVLLFSVGPNPIWLMSL